MSLIRKFGLWRDERGITGLETAIVLIAFVVVASVFAFAVLSTGLLSSEKSKETILGGLEETSATMVLRGSVIGHATSTGVSGWLDYVQFQVSNASQSGDAVSLAGDDMVVTYLDSAQSVNLRNLTASPFATTSQGWNAVWLSGSSPLLNPGDRAEITVGLQSLSHALVVDTEFTIEVKPSVGASMVVQRTIPAEITVVNNLQ